MLAKTSGEFSRLPATFGHRAADAPFAMSGIAESQTFPGFPDLRANVTFTPIQFFTTVLPHRSRGCVRLVGFMLRRLLGWVDEDGNPRQEQISFSYRELTEGAGISRDSITDAIREALKHSMIQCLASPRADQAGQAGQSGIYSLRWNDNYTKAVESFRGFFQREAVVVSEGDSPPVAKAARKNIPNAYFDRVLRTERLSVARVVGAMLFRSIEWGPGGERKRPVCISVTELCRLTQMTRRHVHAALLEAIKRGYVERIKAGRFDEAAGVCSEAATYRIRWTDKSTASVPISQVEATQCSIDVPYPFSDRSEKGYGEPVRKGIRDRSEKEHGNRSEKGYDISIKKSIKTSTTTAMGGENATDIAAAAAAGVIAKLVKAGFSCETAKHLARQHSPDIIMRQIEWLPLRNSKLSRLGLLRRAIEQDWPKPEGGSAPDEVPTENALGAAFARRYKAAFHQQSSPTAMCSRREAAEATEFLARLQPDASEADAMEWGTRFGKYARSRAPAKPWLAWVLPVLGDEFVRQHRQVAERARRELAEQARRVHEGALEKAYEEYLRQAEVLCKTDQPELYARFASEHDALIDRFNLSPTSRAALASDSARCAAFADFVRRHGREVMKFEQWVRECAPAGKC